MANFTHNETILQYLDGELAGTEKQEFEATLRSDARLQEELQGLTLAKEAVQLYGLKEAVASVHSAMMEELKEETPVRKISSVRRFIRYSVAAAASIAVIFLGIQAFKFYQLSSGKLYDEKYQAYEVTVSRDGNAPQLSHFEKAFADKNYKEVFALETHYSKPEASGIISEKDQFIIAMASLETGNNNKAIEKLLVVIDATKPVSSLSSLKEQAEYYLALALLRNKDYDQAIELMKKIGSTNGHTYQKTFNDSYIRRVKMLKWR